MEDQTWGGFADATTSDGGDDIPVGAETSDEMSVDETPWSGFDHSSSVWFTLGGAGRTLILLIGIELEENGHRRPGRDRPR